MPTTTRLNAQVLVHVLRTWTRDRRHDDRGEGVISTAIAVLIVAFLGAAMWVAFNAIWQDSEGNIRTNIEQIGATG
jgi:4-amino-4-deoxy-L-arabinose transferase-like glycosyltransferase